MLYLFIFHRNKGCMKEPPYYVILTLPALLGFKFLFKDIFIVGTLVHFTLFCY